jgi:hypothetical protein
VILVSGKTITQSKREYNKQAYETHLFSYRKNSEFGECLRDFKKSKGTSLNFLITKLLAEHWDVPFPTPEMDI